MTTTYDLAAPNFLFQLGGHALDLLRFVRLPLLLPFQICLSCVLLLLIHFCYDALLFLEQCAQFS